MSDKNNLPDFVAVCGPMLYTNYKQELFSLKLPYKDQYTRALHYGITWNEEDIIVGAHTEMIKMTSHKVFIVKTYENTNNGGHQILFHKDKLYICNDGRNSIDVVDIKNNIILQRIYLYPTPFNIINTKKKITTFDMFDIEGHDEIKDQNVIHVNSIFIDNNDNMFVCCHNKKKPSYIIKIHTDNKVETIKIKGKECHNVFVEDNFLYSLSSKETSVIKYNLKTNKKELINLNIHDHGVPKCNTYLRGLAYDGKHFLIGVAYTDHARDKRDAKPSCVALFDKSFNYIDHIMFKSGAQIRDLRLMRGDLAHNNIPFPEHLLVKKEKE